MFKDVVNIVAGLTVGFGPAVGITLDGQPVLRKTVRDDHGPFVLIGSRTETGDAGEQHHRMSFKSNMGIGVNVDLVTWSHSPFAAISMVLENQSKHVLVWPGEQIYSVPVCASGQGLVWTLTGGPSEAAYEWPRKTIPPSALVRPGIWRGDGYEWPSKCFEVSTTHLPADNVWTLDSGVTGRSTDIYCPWLMIEKDRQTFIASFAYSGTWKMVVSPPNDSGDRLVSAGLRETDYTLSPGKATPVPALYFGQVDGEPEAAAQTWRQFMDQWVIPPLPDRYKGRWPPVVFNTWSSQGLRTTETDLIPLLDIAAELGVDIFTIDAGWYRHSHTDGSAFSKGVGNWQANPDKFPSGLPAFCAQVRLKGMGAGLWFAPERVFSGDVLTAEHPDWLARRDGVLVEDEVEDGKIYLLYFGNPQVREHVFQRISGVLESCRIDWMKWDFYGKPGAYLDAPERGPEAKDGLAAHIAGVYEVMDRLRRRFPDLCVESCAAGGRRFDLGAIRRSHVAFLCDVWAGARLRRSLLNGAGLMVPSRFKSHLIVKDPRTDLATSLRSNFDGVVCLSVDLCEFSSQEKQIMKEEIFFYKEKVRPALMSWRRVSETEDDGRIERWRYIDGATDRELRITFENESAGSPRTLASHRVLGHRTTHSENP